MAEEAGTTGDERRLMGMLAVLFHRAHGAGLFMVRCSSSDVAIVLEVDPLTDDRFVPIMGDHHVFLEHDSVAEAVVRNAPPAKGVN